MFARSEVTRAEAWLIAAEAMQKAHDRLYNVVLEIQKPGLATPLSRAIENEVDGFLRKHEVQPTHSVAETIFPAVEYRQGGIGAVYNYPETIYQFIKSESKWGNYAFRLTQRKCSDGSKIIPLELAINKLKRQLSTSAPKRAAYELDLGLEPLELKLYEAEKDYGTTLGGQCLSHISLKLGPNRELYMTAVYRYQYYVLKAIGNLLGLARLQAAIAREVGIETGPLVCHATMAILEDRQLDNNVSWSRADVTQLVATCRAHREKAIEVAA